MSTDVVTAVDRRAMGDMPVWRTRTLLTVGVMTLCLMLSSEAVMAGNSRAKQAEEEMEFGYKAARRGYWQEGRWQLTGCGSLLSLLRPWKRKQTSV